MLSTVLDLLATGSLAISLVQVYLIVTKLWSRRHDRRVAGAQSMASNLLGLLTGFPWIVKFTLEGEFKQAAVSLLWFMLTIFFTVVALGAGAPLTGQASAWSKLRRALRLEREQAGELARAFLRPQQADHLLQILRQLALIDHHLDPRERAFIDAFVQSWGLASPFGPDENGGPRPVDAEGHAALRRSVQEYLQGRPPRAQAAQLREVLAALAQADAQVSGPESIVLPEITGQLDAYLQREGVQAVHQVMVVPQTPAQDEALRDLLRATERVPFRGGTAYLSGPFYSDDYARMMRDRYRTLGFFAVSEEHQPT